MLVIKFVLDFKVFVVLGNNEVDEYFEFFKNLGKNGVIFFFWLKDFIFVCFIEIIVFDKRVKDF